MEKFRAKIIWTCSYQYVDINTGEELSKEQVKKYYIIIRKAYDKTFNKRQNRGHIAYTCECKRHPQQSIW